MSLTLRNVKGEPLTHQELDDNFTYLLGRADKGYLNIADFQTGLQTTFNNPDEWTALKMNGQQIAKLFNGIDFAVSPSNDETVIFNQTQVKQLTVKLEAVASIAGTNNDEIHFAFFVGGQLWPCSEQTTSIKSNNRSFGVSFHCTVFLNPAQEVQVYVKNRLANNNITLENINIIAEVKDVQDAAVI